MKTEFFAEEQMNNSTIKPLEMIRENYGGDVILSQIAEKSMKDFSEFNKVLIAKYIYLYLRKKFQVQTNQNGKHSLFARACCDINKRSINSYSDGEYLVDEDKILCAISKVSGISRSKLELVSNTYDDIHKYLDRIGFQFTTYNKLFDTLTYDQVLEIVTFIKT